MLFSQNSSKLERYLVLSCSNEVGEVIIDSFSRHPFHCLRDLREPNPAVDCQWAAGEQHQSWNVGERDGVNEDGHGGAENELAAVCLP